MKFRIGYEFKYYFPAPTPVILTLNVHFSRASDLLTPDHVIVRPSASVGGYRDGYGNWCSRMVAPAGTVVLSTNAVISDNGLPDVIPPAAPQVPVESLPEETLVFLLASRFCRASSNGC